MAVNIFADPVRCGNGAAVFLDKDGTVIEDLPYNVDPANIRFMEGAIEAMSLLHEAGFSLFIATNQSGIARGYFSEEDLMRAAGHIAGVLEERGVPLAGFYFCPHLPSGLVPEYSRQCSCRKPEPGMIFRACREHGIDPGRSWFIGDILNDVEAGRKAGCRTVLINNGKETEWVLSQWRLPHHVVGTIYDAARVIRSLSDLPATERIPVSL